MSVAPRKPDLKLDSGVGVSSVLNVRKVFYNLLR